MTANEEPRTDVIARLNALRAEFTHDKHAAARVVTAEELGDGGEWVVLKDVKINGEKHARGARVTLLAAEADRLFRHKFIVAPENFYAGQEAQRKRKFLQDEVFPIESVFNDARREEFEAVDRVGALEQQLAQARQKVEATRAQRQAVEQRLAALLDKVG